VTAPVPEELEIPERAGGPTLRRDDRRAGDLVATHQRGRREGPGR